jgi:hypothetical protein
MPWPIDLAAKSALADNDLPGNQGSLAALVVFVWNFTIA